MRRALPFVILGLLAAPPSPSDAGALEVRLGAFMPNEDSDLFRDDRVLYTVDKDDWNGFMGGIEYNARVARNVELGIHLDGYERSLQTAYRDFTTPTGRDIRQTLKLEIVPIGLTLRVVSTSRRTRVAPYVAIGADLLYWRYEEFGDFIDFDDDRLPIFADSFIADGVAGAGHLAGGVRLRLTHDVSLTAEGRYLAARKVEMGDDFRGLTLDLSGWSATLGARLTF